MTKDGRRQTADGMEGSKHTYIAHALHHSLPGAGMRGRDVLHQRGVLGGDVCRREASPSRLDHPLPPFPTLSPPLASSLFPLPEASTFLLSCPVPASSPPRLHSPLFLFTSLPLSTSISLYLLPSACRPRLPGASIAKTNHVAGQRVSPSIQRRTVPGGELVDVEEESRREIDRSQS